MARTPCTHYNPALGVKYVLVNVVTGEQVVARVLSPKDKDNYPIRSPRNSVRGDEYFKMVFKDGTVRKVMNSLKRERVLTEDGQFEFIGKRPNGSIVPRSNEKIKGVQIAPQVSELSEDEEDALEAMANTEQNIEDEEEVSNLSILDV